jgi:hypothetical protein
MSQALELLALIVAGGAAGAVIVKVSGWVRRFGRRLDALDRVITKELTPNSGSSMKDQSDEQLAKINELSGRLETLEAGWIEHLEQSNRVLLDLYGSEEP